MEIKNDKIENPYYEKCPNPKCKAVLWEWIDEDTVRILGYSEEYVIGFNHIDLVCRECKKPIHKVSKIAGFLKKYLEEDVSKNRDTYEYVKSKGLNFRAYGLLSSIEKLKIEKDLTPIQKRMFDFIIKDAPMDKFVKEVGLSKDMFEKEFDAIREKIKKIKPDFKYYRNIFELLT